MPYELIHGDMLQVLDELYDDGALVDSCVTDPPYELGFMGKSWDSSGIAFRAETWSKVLRIMKPGAHLLAFGGTRGFHRMMVAIEDGGFEIRDTVMWVYGQGFPKSLDVATAFERELCERREDAEGRPAWLYKSDGQLMRQEPPFRHSKANEWEGWGTALKPAWEPVVLARVPFKGTVVDNLLKHGTGALNIDASRVGYISEADKRLETRGVHAGGAYEHADGPAFKKAINKVAEVNHAGRFPANLIHDGSAEVVEKFPETHGAGDKLGKGKFKTGNPNGVAYTHGGSGFRYGDGEDGSGGGNVSRFFYCAKAAKADRNDGVEDFVAPSGAKANSHSTVKPTTLMQYLIKLVTPPGGFVLDPFMGSGSTGKAAMLERYPFIGIEQDPVYIEIADRRIKRAEQSLPTERRRPKVMA